MHNIKNLADKMINIFKLWLKTDIIGHYDI